MELVFKPAGAATPGRTIYVCDMHPESVSDEPGTCTLCNGMTLEARNVPPGGKIVYTCAHHPDIQADAPGKCPQCGMDLRFKVVGPTERMVSSWACPQHKGPAPGPGQCPECGGELQKRDVTEVLAVPASAVVDTGVRRIVFLDKGDGVYELVPVELGARTGEFFQVLAGLNAGDRVVSAGAFLLDAETQLNPAAGAVYFGATGK